jgi:hypothetical protein
MLRLNSKYMSFVASVSVDVSLVAAQPSRSGYPRIVDAPKEAVAADLAHTGELAGFCCTALHESGSDAVDGSSTGT